MAEDRDMLDEIIDMQKDWQALSNPLDMLTDFLDPQAAKKREWNPDDYRHKPRGNASMCVRCIADDPDTCTHCTDVCPVDALSFDDGKIAISDECRMCGLCLAVCPFEALSDNHHTPRRLYDSLARAAAAYEVCYVTCTRALGRTPLANEIVLPCVGLIPAETWFAVLAEYPNLCVYLPAGVCDKCRTTTGEQVYVAQIAEAEELANTSVGLETDEAELTHQKKRSYERREFVDSMVRNTERALAVANPTLLGAQRIAQRLRKHTEQLNALSRNLREISGEMTSTHKRRTLPQRRQLTLAALQQVPQLAKNFAHEVPVCDPTLCTMCGDCIGVCPTHACDLDETGHFSVEVVHCMSCRVCADICPEQALTMSFAQPDDLLIPDEDAERAKAEDQRRKDEVERLKALGRAKLAQGLNLLESLDGEDEAGDVAVSDEADMPAPTDGKD